MKEKKERVWKEFAGTAPHSRSGVYVSIKESGVILLNRRAFEVLGQPKMVSLLFDEENNAMGLRPCNPLMPNAFPLLPRGRAGARAISALAFCKENQIEPTGTIRFLNVEMEKDMMILDFDHTARSTQSPRTGWRKRK